jgi:hypothetical protein
VECGAVCRDRIKIWSVCVWTKLECGAAFLGLLECGSVCWDPTEVWR